MKVSQSLVDFVARREGFRGVAYRPLPTDRWTIGYGSTFIDGKPVVSTDEISEELALSILADTLEEFAAKVRGRGLPVNITNNQFDAVVSLVYNIGFTTFENSNTATRFYAGHDISDRFELYNRSGGKVIPGLTTRRLQEKEIYVNGIYG